MRKVLIITMVLVFNQTLVLSQPCLPEGITFSTQEQIDNFQTNYPNCTEIWGDMEINGENITNLLGLNVITKITGYLIIYQNIELTNLQGLESLSYVGGSLILKKNPVLGNLSGLDNLNSVGNNLIIGYYDLSWPDNYYCEGNPNLSEINSLSNLTSIGGSLIICCNDNLTSLSGLEGINNIPDNLIIGFWEFSDNCCGNIMLSNIDGLTNITTVGGNIEILGNHSLTSLTGLTNVTTINGHLKIVENDVLQSIEGIENIDASTIAALKIYRNEQLMICNLINICESLANPETEISIFDNGESCNLIDLLISCDIQLPCEGNISLTSQTDIDLFPNVFENCTVFDGSISISGNDITSLGGLIQLEVINGGLGIRDLGNLENLEGLNNLEQIFGGLYISNTSLSSLSGLENLTSVYDLTIGQWEYGGEPLGNPDLTSLSGLSGLTTIEGHFRFMFSKEVTSLSGLENLVSVGNWFRIEYHEGLLNLNGLENLGSIGGELTINDNLVLEDISGLSNIDGNTIEELKISYNENLNYCAIESLCQYLATPDYISFIYSNGSACNSTAQVKQACDSLLIENIPTGMEFYLTPNPASNKIRIKIPTPVDHVEIKIINLAGVTIKSIKRGYPVDNLGIDLTDINAGMYFCVLNTQNYTITQKFIKL